jgi:hypothetical protein
MPKSRKTWISFDVGGANIKAAHQSGLARTLPFELWKRRDDLPNVMVSLAESLPAFGRIALTMTAELCDCYATKAEGVLDVLKATKALANGREVIVWGVDRRFHSAKEIEDAPYLAAAANWLALAEVVARLVPQGAGILIDIGSTTTDLIPLADGMAHARGRTDTERLQTGELVYVGVRRTPLCAIATDLPFQGLPTGLMAEFFASTLDIYLTLEETQADPTDLSTADGRPATKSAALNRMARMVGADKTNFSNDDAIAFAHAADKAVLDRLESAAIRACESTIGRPLRAVVSGSGEFLARRLAERLGCQGVNVIGLREAWGPIASSAGCAHALAILAPERADADLATERQP